jgi:hypothetical protein
VPEPAALKEYRNDLSHYLQSKDIPFVDFSHSERLTPSLFVDINHLNLEGKRVLTKMLVEAIRPILNP